MINTGDKVATIISQHFELPIAGAVLSYLFSVGIDNVKQLTDEQINKMEGNALMDQKFVQALVRTARAIAQQCSLYQDILPFITCTLPNMNCQTRELTIWRQDADHDEEGSNFWEELGEVYGDDVENHFGYEWSELDNITFKAVVVDAERKCD